jgi:ATP-dependent DNA ligase
VGPGLRWNQHIEDDGQTIFRHACKLGLEGIVSKRKDSPYRSGRSPNWLKIKNPASARAGLEGRATFLGCRARSDEKKHSRAPLC